MVRHHPEGPADDPRADEVLALLERVPKDSVDALAASSLRERIEGERREAAAERARREKAVARAAVPAPPIAGGAMTVAGGAMTVAGGAMTVPGGAPAAPAPATADVSPGTTLDAFRAAYGECFGSAGPVQVGAADAGLRPGEMWVMKDDQGCRDAHPRLVGQAVLFVGDALAGVSPLAALKRVEVRREVDLGALPDGGTGMVVDGGVVPLPPGAKLLRVDGGTAP
jgi:hypothetical protein